MKDALLVIAGIITIASVIPYIRDIIRGKTKPNITSWVTWTLLTAIATAAEIASHEYRTAIFTGSTTMATGLVVILGLRYGYVKYSKFDVACQVGAIVGLLLWWAFNSAVIAILASVTIDFIGALPTLQHSWNQPDEEAWQTFAIAAFGGVLGLLALNHFNIISLAYPLYIVGINIVMSSIILSRGSRQPKLRS